ncbi:hypothetical protein [Vitiosangium sp. GDMCC 1.1324]|uniref:hypothetical protein n=1 Tax=Vitiosangium sp. (strain GDMCC 1.1324) TaxID=2138576 RepID=UPI000D37FBB1|nr:hypothetical protein [Vitiosangium sp. GDMCC 1.1324]PTL81647.1 hypothetical protein DAT35_22120 [Vitiosangium sp. GDMCC 1.1324]
MKTRHGARYLLLLAVWGSGCNSSSPEPSDESEDTDTSELTYKPCDASQRVGQFTVELGEGYTAVQGRVLSGVVPANVRQVEAQEGECRLLRGRTLFCDPACGASQTCGEGGVCIAYPTARSVGTVRVQGLKAELSMTPNSAKFYSSAGTTLPHPGFDEGATLKLVAGGADVEAFSLRGQGVAALAASEGAITLERDKPVTVSWTPSASSAAARIHLVVDLAHHGGIAASLECDGLADTGSFTLPTGLVSRLLDVGVAGFPKVSISRRSADSVTTSAGCVDLLVLSQVDREILIPGLVSCSGDEDCPEGKTCHSDLTCQ